MDLTKTSRPKPKPNGGMGMGSWKINRIRAGLHHWRLRRLRKWRRQIPWKILKTRGWIDLPKYHRDPPDCLFYPQASPEGSWDFALQRSWLRPAAMWLRGDRSTSGKTGHWTKVPTRKLNSQMLAANLHLHQQRHVDTYSSFLHRCQNQKANTVFFSRRMD